MIDGLVFYIMILLFFVTAVGTLLSSWYNNKQNIQKWLVLLLWILVMILLGRR